MEYNASVTKKLPVFAIQFLESNEVYLIIKPELLEDMAKYIQTGEYINGNMFIGVDLSEHEDMTTVDGKIIKSSSNARERFKEENEQKFSKGKRSAT